MKKWWYEGFTVGGQVTSGEIEADSREQVAEMMRGRNVYLQQIKEVGAEKIQPVLPKKQASFEEELGFIDTKKTEVKLEPPPKPEPEPEPEPEEEPAPSKQELEDWANTVRQAREELLAETEKKAVVEASEKVLEETQEVLSASASGQEQPKEEKLSCCGSCGGCGTGSETPCVVDTVDEELEEDLKNLSVGIEKLATYLIEFSNAKTEEQILVIVQKARDVSTRVMERIIYDYVQRRRGIPRLPKVN